MKGGKRANAGRRRGTKGRRVLEWEAFGKQLLGGQNLQRALDIMDSADDDDFMKHFTVMVEYFRPKLARTEIDAKGEINHSLTLIKKIEAVNPNGASLNGSGNLHLHTGTD